MEVLSDMRSAVQTALNVSSTSSLYPSATIDAALNRAYQKSAALFRWPALEDAKLTTTQANQEYYDAPDSWRPDSMWRLTVDGDDNVYGETPDGSPMVYKDYLDWRADDLNDGSTTKKWAVQELRYFIHPVPTSAGLVISIWGQKNVTEMTTDASTTIFSESMPECNEAIVLEATAILNKKGEKDKTGQMNSDEAKQILIVAFSKIGREQAKYEKTQPFFEVSDMFGTGTTEQKIGQF